MNKTIHELTPGLKHKLSVTNPALAQELLSLRLDPAALNLVLADGDSALGWYSLWSVGTPQYLAYKSGALGSFYADSSLSAQILLDHARTKALERGLNYLIAPLDRCTWYGYRLTTADSGHPPFFTDRQTPLEWVNYFTRFGFRPIAEYYSTLSTDLDYRDEAGQAWQKKADRGELEVRSIDLEHYDEELERIHALCLRAFAENFLYTSIAFDEFAAIYRPLKRHIRPELVQMVYKDGKLAAFFLCLPDYAQEKRGQSIDTLILKTFARDPALPVRGLGAFIIWRAHQTAKEHGFKQLITAFMHKNNKSYQLALKAGRPIRSYALYGIEL